MLTRVILEGPMGKEFGREWNIRATSPNNALKIINANKAGVFAWIKTNLEKYKKYRVTCEYENGEREDLDSDSYPLDRYMKSIRFIPIIAGAGSADPTIRTLEGVTLIAIGATISTLGGMPATGSFIMSMGASMTLSGIAQSLTSVPSLAGDTGTSEKKTSYNFNGPVNTTAQGVPVTLIYGRVLVGSHNISSALSIGQIA